MRHKRVQVVSVEVPWVPGGAPKAAWRVLVNGRTFTTVCFEADALAVAVRLQAS